MVESIILQIFFGNLQLSTSLVGHYKHCAKHEMAYGGTVESPEL
jgi:hypothetical protein